MPLVCGVTMIKYTVVMLNEEDFTQIVDGVEQSRNSDGIYGFIEGGQFRFSNAAEVPDGHWLHEIIAAHPDDLMMIIEGSPAHVDGILDRYIAMEQDWYHQHDLYDLWQTPVGYVAVC